jgi:hypothetical protein
MLRRQVLEFLKSAGVIYRGDKVYKGSSVNLVCSQTQRQAVWCGVVRHRERNIVEESRNHGGCTTGICGGKVRSTL